MTPQQKYGDEFFIDNSMLTPVGEIKAKPHCQIAVCILPDLHKPTTLDRAWGIVRELAQWTSVQNGFPEDQLFTIIVGWSKKVRASQGQIFKVWGDKRRTVEIGNYEHYTDYQPGGSFHVPLIRWEQDVWGPLSDDIVRERMNLLAEARPKT